MGSVQPRARLAGSPRNGSKPMAPIGLPNVPPVSDTSNRTRSTIRRVILVNESLLATGIPRVEFIYSPAFLERDSIHRILFRILRFPLISFDVEFLPWQCQASDLVKTNPV